MVSRSRLFGWLLVVSATLLLLAVGAALADGLPPGGTFTDDNGNIHEGNIEAIAAEGITKGCNPPTNDLYCPSSSLTRGQMAAFIRRALELPSSSIDYFVDDDDSVFEGDINALAEAGITKGCNPPTSDRYCPDGNITREQMAAFLRRAFEYPAATVDYFADDDASIFEGDINAIAEAGVTRGCNPPTNDRYCPKDLVKRDQMASFFARALDLSPIYPPPPTTTTPPTTTPPTTTPPTTTPPSTVPISLSTISGDRWSGYAGSDSVSLSTISGGRWSGYIGSDGVSLSTISGDRWSGYIGSDSVSLSTISGDRWSGYIGSDSVSLSTISGDRWSGTGPPSAAALIPTLFGPKAVGWDSIHCTFDRIPMWGSVYVTSSSLIADVIVYDTVSSFIADLVVNPVSSSLAANSCGEWYFTSSSLAADFSVYFTSSSLVSDLVVYFTGPHP